jgi:hypothetical protein
MAPTVEPDCGTRIGPHAQGEVPTMLWTIFVIILVLWLLGLIGSVGGGLIHLLLLVAAVVLVVQLLSGRSTV